MSANFDPILPCQQPKVVSVSSSKITDSTQQPTASIITKAYFEEWANNVSGISTVTELTLGKLFRFCIEMDKEPLENTIGGIGLLNIKQGNNSVINSYIEKPTSLDIALGSLSHFEVIKNQKESTKFYSEWFIIPISQYHKIIDKDSDYDYGTHTTTNPNFSIEAKYIYKGKDGSSRVNIKTYPRNYEEWVGTHLNNNGILYEEYFISRNSIINTRVLSFVKAIECVDYRDEAEALKNIKDLVTTHAKGLWDGAVKTNTQASNVDDRPLYWARNRMEVVLKRHPVFDGDYGMDSSISGEIANLIARFEELSRNYTGIEFKENIFRKILGGGKKKVLITGFDPFMINSIDHPDYRLDYNIEQSNPSGCVALYFNSTKELKVNIQTMIVPVRYQDFDSSTDKFSGQGIGIIEKYIGPLINQVDMIITVSQAGEGDYNIDKYATVRRGGFNDNMDFVRIAGSQCISLPSPTDKEWIETTLTPKFLNAPNVKYNFDYIDQNGMPQSGNITPPTKGNIIYEGPGGSYLSNEIFYRVAKLRQERKDKKGESGKLPTGHFHISKLQNSQTKIRYSPVETKKMLEIVEQAIKEGVKGI